MTGPAFSVALPVHNGAEHLEEAIESLLGQSFADFELVICDDGSTDATGAIAERLAASDPRIRLCRRPVKSGVAAAANWAASECRAPLVAIAHADDLSLPDRLARQHAVFAAYPDCVLSGAPTAAINWHGEPAHPPNLWRLLHPGPFAPIAHSSVAFRRDAFLVVGGYGSDVDYWEDLDLYWRMARQGRIMVLPDPVSIYRYSRISIRQREDAGGVERALERMYRSAEAIGAGRARPDPAAPPLPTERLHPRIFVARSWSQVWAGERPGLFGALLARGRLRFDRATLESLCFVAWASLSPRSLRAALRAITRLRNRIVLRRLAARDAVEWRPLDSGNAGPLQ